MTPTRCCCGERCRNPIPVHDDTTGELLGRLGALVDDGSACCEACTLATAAALTQLPHDYTDLAELLQPSTTQRLRDPELPPHTGKPEPGLPLRADVLDLQLLIDYETGVWAESVADHDDVEWSSYDADHSRPADRIRRACELLNYRVATLLALGPTEHRARSLAVRRADGHDPDRTTRGRDDYWTTREGWEAGLLFRDLHHKTVRYCGRERADRIPMPCPRCGLRALIREHRAGRVRCIACGNPMPDNDYDAFRNYALAAHGLPELDTTPAETCPRCGSTAGHWTDRHQRHHCRVCGPDTGQAA